MFTKIRPYTVPFVFAFLLACQTDDDAKAPVADFVAAANGDYSLEVEFRNTSQHAVAYVWDFGDNTTSTEETPTHTYARGGTHTITLIATGSNAKTDTLTRAVDVKAADACAALQLEKELTALDAYLTAEHITTQAGPSGLRYVIHREGEGIKPTATSVVDVDYVISTLYYPNQHVLDQGNVHERLNLLIRAWQVALPMFPVGTRATLYFPSCLGYGEEGKPGDIEPYTALKCYIELQAVEN
jgi:PKD repeat protein